MVQQWLDHQVLYGRRLQRFAQDWLTHSGIFWIIDSLRKITNTGLESYAVELPHWILLASTLIQAWIISKDPNQIRWWYYLIAPLLYSAAEILLEGFANFIAAPYHAFYWLWAGGFIAAHLIERRAATWATLLRSFLMVLPLPLAYMLSEWQIASEDLTAYWLYDSAHFFILLGTIVLGLLLGIVTIMRDHFERLLYQMAAHLQHIASWSFDNSLIAQSYQSQDALHLQRLEKAILFMDIRGFTTWTEAHSPQEVVEMINAFYSAAERIISQHGGFKIQMIGDEIMTRFAAIDDALAAALQLKQEMGRVLKPYGLNVGIGIHCGEVVEGLVGTENTRQYGIFGDAVNVTARLQSQAQSGQIVVSQTAWERLQQKPSTLKPQVRELTLKGKQEPMLAYCVS